MAENQFFGKGYTDQLEIFNLYQLRLRDEENKDTIESVRSGWTRLSCSNPKSDVTIQLWETPNGIYSEIFSPDGYRFQLF